MLFLLAIVFPSLGTTVHSWKTQPVVGLLLVGYL